MRTKLLFGVIALSAAFAACNNEELQGNLVNEEALVENEIIGAKLVSEGMSITLGNGMESRVVNGSWEATDKIAMAYYHYKDGKIGENDSKDEWGNGTRGNEMRVFANHLFTWAENGKFETNSNVYEGAHFLYFPYVYQPKIAQLDFTINGPQTTVFESDQVNEALQISAQDYIDEGDVNTENGYVSKDFVMAPAVNAIAVVTAPEDAIKNQEFLKTLEMSELRLWAKGVTFATSAKVNPNKIPAVVRDNNGELDKKATKAALDNAFMYEATDGVFEVTGESWLATTIDADLALNQENILRSFVLPIEGLEEKAGDMAIRINVTKNGYNMGQFQVSDKDALERLSKIVTKEGDKEGATLTKLYRNEDGEWMAIALYADMLIKDFHADYNISDLEEWNLTVAMVDALNSLKGEDETKDVPTFVLSNDIKFDGGEIRTPAAGVKVTGKSMEIASNVVWPTNLSGGVSVIVEPNATVDVNSNANNGVKFYLKNGSVINMNEVASEIKLANDTEGSRININKYGAKVELTENATQVANAIVAYNLPKDYKNYQVNNLMTLTAATGETREFARVNTIVVGKGVVFDLGREDKKESTDDPYTGEDVNIPAQKVNADLIADVDIEMNGGTIKNGEVADIIALAGTTSTVIDVNSDNITLEEGAKLTITTDDEKKAGDPTPVVTTGNLTIGKSATVTAHDVIVEYGDWTNLGTSNVKGNGEFVKKN